MLIKKDDAASAAGNQYQEDKTSATYEDEDESEDEEDTEESDCMGEDFDDDVGCYSYDKDEDVGPLETEVEQEEHSMGGQQSTFKIFLQEEDDEWARWMKTIHVTCSHEGKEIGRGLGRYVIRDRIRANFWREMEEPCEELSKIAFELFDRYGRLKREFKDHPIRKGTGVWGTELDLGSFFVIEEMKIDKEWRRNGIGTRIMRLLIAKSQTGGRNPDFVLVAPGWLTRDIEPDLEGKTKLEQHEIKFRVADGVCAFYRSLGFRRIGSSFCFGLAIDPTHAAHGIAVANDFDPNNAEPDSDEGPKIESVRDWDVASDRTSWRLKLLEQRLPLHHAAITLSDDDCVNALKVTSQTKSLPANS